MTKLLSLPNWYDLYNFLHFSVFPIHSVSPIFLCLSNSSVSSTPQFLSITFLFMSEISLYPWIILMKQNAFLVRKLTLIQRRNQILKQYRLWKVNMMLIMVAQNSMLWQCWSLVISSGLELIERTEHRITSHGPTVWA